MDSPSLPLLEQRKRSYYNVDESDRVLFDDTVSALVERGRAGRADSRLRASRAAPQDLLRPFQDPRRHRHLRRALPGLQRRDPGIVMELHFLYGVRRIHGFCNGYQGFIPKYKRPVLELTPQSVSQINEHGGTILGTSRGEQDPARSSIAWSGWASTSCS